MVQSENGIIIAKGRAIAGHLQREADPQVEIVPAGLGARQNEARKQTRIIAVRNRNGCVAGSILVRPMEPSEGTEDAERRAPA
jgi:hypothetical protein